MAKNAITEYDQSPSGNSDIGGISLLGSASPRNIKDYVPELMSQLADMNAGTSPLDDTFAVRDPEDKTKKARLDAENVPGGTERALDAEALYQILQRGATPRLITPYTASGTHTFNAATKVYKLVAVGGGGGSGGVDGQGSGTGGATAGGNSGFMGETGFLTKGALTTGTVVIGAGGTAGTATIAGGAGGDTTWADATVGTLTWKGGKGTAALDASGTYRYSIPTANDASSGSLFGSGPAASAGHSNGVTNAGGIGGSNQWGTGGVPAGLANNAAVAAVSGTGYGAGASGAASNGTTDNAAGAAGTGGRLEVWEF